MDLKKRVKRSSDEDEFCSHRQYLRCNTPPKRSRDMKGIMKYKKTKIFDSFNNNEGRKEFDLSSSNDLSYKTPCLVKNQKPKNVEVNVAILKQVFENKCKIQKDAARDGKLNFFCTFVMFKFYMIIQLRQGRIQKFFEGGVLKFFCIEGKI